MSRKKTKDDETRIDSYGRGEVLTDCKEPNAERELWCGVILQAIVNVRFKVKGWQDSLEFIAGGGNWNWICEQLGMDAKRASKEALNALNSRKKIFGGNNNETHKERNQSIGTVNRPLGKRYNSAV